MPCQNSTSLNSYLHFSFPPQLGALLSYPISPRPNPPSSYFVWTYLCCLTHPPHTTIHMFTLLTYSTGSHFHSTFLTIDSTITWIRLIRDRMFLTCPASIILVNNNDRDFGCCGGTHCGCVCPWWYYLFLYSKSRHVAFGLIFGFLSSFFSSFFVILLFLWALSSMLLLAWRRQPSTSCYPIPPKRTRTPRLHTVTELWCQAGTKGSSLCFERRQRRGLMDPVWAIWNLEFKTSGSFSWQLAVIGFTGKGKGGKGKGKYYIYQGSGKGKWKVKVFY